MTEGEEKNMGAYPGARLLYGIDLGDQDGYMPEEPGSLELEEIAKNVDDRLSLEFTGDLHRDYTRYLLASRVYNVYAYDAVPITPETLLIPKGHREMLQTAFREMYPDREVPEPQWLLTVHYG